MPIRAPFVTCPNPGCGRQFRRNLRQRCACSQQCAEAMRHRQLPLPNGWLMHPSWIALTNPPTKGKT